MDDDYGRQHVPAIIEYRVRELEKRIDNMQLSLATKDDVQRVERAVTEIRETQKNRDSQSFDFKKALWPPILAGIVITVANALLTGYFAVHH